MTSHADDLRNAADYIEALEDAVLTPADFYSAQVQEVIDASVAAYWDLIASTFPHPSMWNCSCSACLADSV